MVTFYKRATISSKLYPGFHCQGSAGGSVVENLPTSARDEGSRIQSLVQEDLLEKKMATHSNVLAWKTPWTEKSSRL